MRSPPYPSCCTCWISPDASSPSTPWAARRKIAREIVEVQADYLLAVKKNQGQLYEDVRDLFEGAQEFDFEGVPYDFARTVSKNHGRLETRQCWVITDPDCLDYIQTRQQWAKLNAVVKVTAQREMATGTSVQSGYYISSLASQAKELSRNNLFFTTCSAILNG